MTKVGAYEAKTHLPRLLEKVRRGERITITKHGVSVAMLVPVEHAAGRPVADTVSALHRFRRGMRLDGLSLSDLIGEGRR
ncbi:MAG: type II toxin-antitoxin system prevent-host-death family antitoxin [Alphaproteobacteria bacterium]|jgi:prevent-host-death family protein|nr:type II toxin-antitoxin system prevent-host-death family antitoxin [Pseudomonadota bacterium]MCZ6466974.1 type II toxin-antitoxin system prevent-host-death family antitoxin [Alphaproteobacteria bacterium]MCZ6606941.1 type II toxin-antitoxin system prevent-host-death family antitoxin [Alphaproteobacteria bacterium]